MDERDLTAIEDASGDAEILKWFDLDTGTPGAYLARKREAWARGTGASFAICDAARPNTCVGHVFIERGADGRGSVGYWLLERGRRKGRATRAVRLMASWGTSALRLDRLELHTDPENVASQRVAEKAGFTREGVLRAYSKRRDGARADAVIYALVSEDPGTAGPAENRDSRLGQRSGMTLEARPIRRRWFAPLNDAGETMSSIV